MQRVERDEYPVAAVREMILNSLVNRPYMGAPTQIRLHDNNFSVWNDGRLPEGITEDDLKKVHRSKPRNPLIAKVCFKGGYIDAWGRGTIKIIEACEEARLPEPVLKEEQGGFLSKVFKAAEVLQRKSEGNILKTGDPFTILQQKYGEVVEEIRKNCGRNYSLNIFEPDKVRNLVYAMSKRDKAIRNEGTQTKPVWKRLSKQEIGLDKL